MVAKRDHDRAQQTQQLDYKQKEWCLSKVQIQALYTRINLLLIQAINVIIGFRFKEI